MKQNEKIQPHIQTKYEIIKKLGSGAYGHVWKAKEKKTGCIVALKKIFDAFQHSTDAQRTFRQISVLKQLKHDKIIKLNEVLPSYNNKDIYLVFEFMQSDLYHLLYDNKLQPIHIKYIMYQIVLGLHYLHNSKLIHRDLKPSNILVNSDCSAKICDFGLVRFLGSNLQNYGNTLTEGVATRWYRAPQVLLGSNSYGPQADMWSLGCILGEILLKNPMFPGNCTTNQLQRILQFTGQPSVLDVKSIRAQLAQVMISQVCNGKIKKKFDIFGSNSDKKAIDLINKLLQFNPNKRLTTSQALRHQYFQEFYNQSDQVIKIQNIQLQIDENTRLETKQYLDIINQKFVNKTIGRDQSTQKSRKRICQSPKSFSDLKKSRVSSKNESQSNSVVKARIRAYTNNDQQQCVKDDNIPATSLFKQLCKQKQRQKSIKKNPSRGTSKQNICINQNSTNQRQKQNQKQKSYGGFKSFAGVTNIVQKYGDQKKISSFAGLRKTTKISQK